MGYKAVQLVMKLQQICYDIPRRPLFACVFIFVLLKTLLSPICEQSVAHGYLYANPTNTLCIKNRHKSAKSETLQLEATFLTMLGAAH